MAPKENTPLSGILTESGTNEVEFLLFHLGAQRYGINVGKVRQILLFNRDKVAHLPGLPPAILGLMPFRENTISIIDLREMLSVPAEQRVVSARDLLLVAELNLRTVGFVVDSVDKIERLGWERFEPIGQTTCAGGSGSVVGTVTLKDGIVVILDLETIMGSLDPTMNVDHYASEIAPSTIDRGSVRILYCEDSAIVQKALVRTLESAGFTQVQLFPTGLAGLEYLEKNPSANVDIIISDIEMPQMDGLTFCRKVHELKTFQKVPFVFFSSMINAQMEEKCRSVGGDACYSKPQIPLIVTAIEQLLQEKRQP